MACRFKYFNMGGSMDFLSFNSFLVIGLQCALLFGIFFDESHSHWAKFLSALFFCFNLSVFTFETTKVFSLSILIQVWLLIQMFNVFSNFNNRKKIILFLFANLHLLVGVLATASFDYSYLAKLCYIVCGITVPLFWIEPQPSIEIVRLNSYLQLYIRILILEVSLLFKQDIANYFDIEFIAYSVLGILSVSILIKSLLNRKINFLILQNLILSLFILIFSMGSTEKASKLALLAVVLAFLFEHNLKFSKQENSQSLVAKLSNNFEKNWITGSLGLSLLLAFYKSDLNEFLIFLSIASFIMFSYIRYQELEKYETEAKSISRFQSILRFAIHTFTIVLSLYILR